jgi:D-glycero-D-manno-heptose 1,7-bisphosphate phosphatase
LFDEAFVQEVHRELNRRIAPATIDGYFYCPHLADARIAQYQVACDCRKPKPGLIVRACQDLDLDPSRSFMVGDRLLDVACGRAAGVRSILVRTGHGAHEETHVPAPATASAVTTAAVTAIVPPDAILNNLMEAVGWILRSSSPS